MLRISLIYGGIIVAIATLVLTWPVIRDSSAIVVCGRTDDAAAIDCWLEIMREHMRVGDITGAMAVFTRVYDAYPIFAQTGCHRHAHRVGDMAYFELYLVNPNFDAMDFPQVTAGCGYGFFHGFFEHLIQDNPDSAFISETCAYFDKRLSSDMRNIRKVCYHGSGHGLVLAESERLPKSAWGHVSAFAARPLAECEELKGASTREREECQEGVFNVIVDWMVEKDYGFSLDDKQPFAACSGQKYEWKRACYFEIAQTFSRLSDWSIPQLVKLLEPVSDRRLHDLAFAVGATGMLQKYAGTNEYERFMHECTSLESRLVSICFESVVTGLFAHGPPQKEYKSAFAACSLPDLADMPAIAICWKAFAERLSRFYSPDRSRDICATIPEGYREYCLTSA